MHKPGGVSIKMHDPGIAPKPRRVSAFHAPDNAFTNFHHKPKLLRLRSRGQNVLLEDISICWATSRSGIGRESCLELFKRLGFLAGIGRRFPSSRSRGKLLDFRCLLAGRSPETTRHCFPGPRASGAAVQLIRNVPSLQCSAFLRKRALRLAPKPVPARTPWRAFPESIRQRESEESPRPGNAQ